MKEQDSLLVDVLNYSSQVIRVYTDIDRSAVLDLIDQNIPKFFHDSERAELELYLDNELQDYFVIEEDDQIVGCGGVNWDPSKKLARLAWDIIHPVYQGQGIGSELVQYRINHILEKYPAKSIEVRTSKHAFNFYAKLGFVLSDIGLDHWATGYDLYRMVKEL